MVFIYTTCPSVKWAKRISNELIKERLAGCCNFWQSQSNYWWEDKILRGREVALLIKTVKKQVAHAKRLIEKIHPYDVPCIAVLSAKQLNAEYKKWLARECK